MPHNLVSCYLLFVDTISRVYKLQFETYKAFLTMASSGVFIAAIFVSFISISVQLCPSGYYLCSDKRCCNHCDCILPSIHHCTPPSFREECKKPKGDTCDWYSGCLNKHFDSCVGSENYAINYGQKFCNKYSDKLGWFNNYGKGWVGSVRKCLQEKLADQADEWPSLSCSEIKDRAFKSHAECYINPGDGSSFCDLSCLDLLAVTYITNDALFDAPVETFHEGLGVAGHCIFANKDISFAVCFTEAIVPAEIGITLGNAFFRQVKFSVDFVKDIFRDKRSVSQCDDYCIARRLVDTVFQQMYPDGNSNSTVERFVFDKRKDNDTLEVRLWISDLAFLNTNGSAPIDRTAMDDAANKFLKTVVDDKVLKIDGKQIALTELAVCGDLNCTGTGALDIDVNTPPEKLFVF